MFVFNDSRTIRIFSSGVQCLRVIIHPSQQVYKSKCSHSRGVHTTGDSKSSSTAYRSQLHIEQTWVGEIRIFGQIHI